MRQPLSIPPGIVSDDTSHEAAGRWRDGNNMRFYNGLPQVIGGHESVIADLLGGVCRSAFPWTDGDAALNIGFGTHATLEVFQGGELFDITPTKAFPAATLAADPLTVADASALITVNHPGHGLTTADSVIVSGALQVGRIAPNGTFAVTVLDEDTYTYTFSSPADLAETLANDPLTTTNGSPTVTVTDTAHGIPTGTVVTISGAAAVGGITPNGSFAITVVNANSYTFQFTSNASSAATGGGAAVVVTVPTTGGGSAVVVTPQNAFAAGAVDGTGSVGYGTGAYGVGAYGEPSTSDYFPRTWSQGAFGYNLMASPRGGTIYTWANDTSVVAAPLANAPRQVTYMLVASQDQVFALGCNEESSGEFNHLCIRHSGVRKPTVWNTATDTTAREYILPGGGRIVAGRVIGPYILIWTTQGLFLGQFLASVTQPWRFDRVGDKCGLIGPNAVVVVGQTAYWISPDQQFYTYSLGGEAKPIPCPIREDFADNLAASQADKIVASSISQFSEVRFDYPDARDGFENSRYVALCVSGPDVGAWYRGQMARTAMVDAGPSQYPCGVSADSAIFWHERGASADGGAFDWHIESADQYLDENRAMMVRAIWPDFRDQQGAVTLTLTGRDTPQGNEIIQTATLSEGDDKADLRITARLFRLKFSGSSGPAYVRLGKPIFDVVGAGLR